MATKATTLVDDTYYKVTVTRAVTVMGALQWRPEDELITATGALIKQLVARPENADAIVDDFAEVI